MRIFANCLEMENEVKRDLHEMGTVVWPSTMQDKHVATDPNYQTLELSPYDFMIMDGSDRDELVTSRNGSLDWCRDEFVERINNLRANPGVAWKRREGTWKEFMHDGEFAYTYGERMGRLIQYKYADPNSKINAIDQIVGELMANPNSRQCVLPIFDARDDLPNLGGLKRVPCSLHYQFTIRDGELRIFYVMRSSDFATHFVYDIWMALELQRYVASLLDLAPGRMTFFTGSLHLYRKDWDQKVF